MPPDEAADEEGVRRRRSHDYHDDAEIGVDGARDGVHVGTRTLSLHEASTQRSSGSDITPPLSSSRPMSTGEAGVTRNIAGKKRKSDEIARDSPTAMEAHGSPSSPMRIDTRAANNPTQRRPPVHTTPSSPRSRHRGMSLRTSLFTRNVDRATPAGDSIIEMHDLPGSSSQFSDSDHVKKDIQPSVSVTAIHGDFGPPTPERTRHGRISLLPSTSADGSLTKGPRGMSVLPNYQQWMQEQANRHLPVRRAKQTYKQLRKWILRIQEIPPSKDGRHIPLDPHRKKALIDERTRRPFVSNFIKSSKYTLWNFLPRQLFAQFSKLANLYFLTISILQMIPGLSTTGSYTTIIPLMCFVSISMAKEGYEDFRRHRLDKAENNREALVLHAYRPVQVEAEELKDGPVHWATVKWQSLQVGDIVKVDRDQPIPADIMLLSSKGPNNTAYIETMALDGETNLKTKQPSAALIGKCATSEDIVGLTRTEMAVEDPNLDLYNFEGRLSVRDDTSPLTNNEIIYRGSILRNTPEAIGVILYTGDECKIRMNANRNPRIKAPSLQGVVNKIVIFMVFFVVGLALINTIAYQVWHVDYEQKAWYLTDAHVAFIPIIVSFIIMFNTMIPLSLYVSLEIIKVSQMALMNCDLDMYDEASNTPFEARTSTINEELGQVSYIFSDKTGTLTENVMRLRKLSVGGAAWLHDTDLKDTPKEDRELHDKTGGKSKGKRAMWKLPRKSMTGSRPSINNMPKLSHEIEAAPRNSTTSWHSAVPAIRQPDMSTAEIIRYIQRNPQTPFAKRASMMILSLAVCHTCLPEIGQDGELSYQAASPDERALVEAASELGYTFFDKTLSTLTLKTFPNGPAAEPVLEKYELLDVIDFSSTRKRMSVVLAMPDGRLCVVCKGADSVITERLRLADLARQKIAEVERRASQRRNLEAQEVLHRKSESADRRSSVGSFPRTSLTLRSGSVVGRASFGRLTPIKDDDDDSLVDRSAHTPRASAQIGRHSVAYSEHVRSEARVEESVVTDESTVIERCFQHVNDFATEGLRTLLYAHRYLSDDEYRSWKKVYQDATTSLIDRQQKIEAAGELIEQSLELTGATAIEDKLQQGVPETIERLRRANIKLWMLTGDKRETAINIGHSCHLIKDYSTMTILDHEAGDVETTLTTALLNIHHATETNTIAHSVIVIDGRTLAHLQASPTLHTLFLDLAILADSVISCRASPSQKAHLVHAIRRRVNRSVTLAIGDGANDIAMIQESHVGVGITGKEGLQAARCADYAVAQFRFLQKLLLVHGHWNYVRTCKYTLATFWKEMLFYLTQALYQHCTGYTGTSLYEQWSLSQFNTLFTSLPVIFLGIFDQDLRPATLLAHPELYSAGQRNAHFNFRLYLAWISMAIAEAALVFFTMETLWGAAVQPVPGGQDLYSMGFLTFTACVVIINTKLQVLMQRYRTYLAAGVWALEVGGWFAFNAALSLTYADNYIYDVKGALLRGFGREVGWWVTLGVTILAVLVWEVLVRVVLNVVMPTEVEVWQELEGDVGLREKLGPCDGEELGLMGSGRERGMEEQAKREDEVRDLLDFRERGLDKKDGVVERIEFLGQRGDDGEDESGSGPVRKSTDEQETLSKRFGSVRRGSLGG